MFLKEINLNFRIKLNLIKYFFFSKYINNIKIQKNMNLFLIFNNF